jgi:hypothetical protein
MANGANNPADPGSWNRYAYAGNDPTNFNDRRGLLMSDDPINGCDIMVNGECEPGDDPCLFGDGFLPAPGCPVGVGSPPPSPIKPAPQECSIELWQRPTPSGTPAKGWGNHTYIYISGTGYPGVPSLGILPGIMIEAGPVHGKLTGMINPPGQGLANGKWNASNRFIFSTRQKNSWVSSGSGSLPSE